MSLNAVRTMQIVLSITLGASCTQGSTQQEGVAKAQEKETSSPAKKATPKPEDPKPVESALPNLQLPAESVFQPDHRLSASAAIYEEGPQQARPPDGELKPGTEVQVIREEGSYVRIRLEDGREVSIAKDALAPFEGKTP